MDTSDKISFILSATLPKDAIYVFSCMIRDKPLHVVNGIIKTMIQNRLHVRYIMEAVYNANVEGSVLLANMAYRILCMDDLCVDTATYALTVCYRSKEYLPAALDIVKIFERVMRLCPGHPFHWKCTESALLFLKAFCMCYTQDQMFRLVSCLSAEMIYSFSDITMHLVGGVALLLGHLNVDFHIVWSMTHDWIVALESYLRQSERGSDIRNALHNLCVFINIGQSPESYSQPNWPMLINAISLTVCKLGSMALIDKNRETLAGCFAIMQEVTKQVWYTE